MEYETCIKMLEVWQEVEMIRSQKFGTKFQVAGYGGLENMKHMVVKHIMQLRMVRLNGYALKVVVVEESIQ